MSHTDDDQIPFPEIATPTTPTASVVNLVLSPTRRHRKPPRAKRCVFCDGSAVQGSMCGGDYCACGGDGHLVRCYWCNGTGLLSKMKVVTAEYESKDLNEATSL